MGVNRSRRACRRRGACPGLDVFLGQLLEGHFLQLGLGEQSCERAVLRLTFLEPFGVVGFQAAVLVSPPGVGPRTPGRLSQHLDRREEVRPPQYPSFFAALWDDGPIVRHPSAQMVWDLIRSLKVVNRLVVMSTLVAAPPDEDDRHLSALKDRLRSACMRSQRAVSTSELGSSSTLEGVFIRPDGSAE